MLEKLLALEEFIVRVFSRKKRVQPEDPALELFRALHPGKKKLVQSSFVTDWDSDRERR